MIDFILISTRVAKRGTIEIYPTFLIKRSNDLMIRGGDFYAIWVEERGMWSTDEQDVIQIIDRELDAYAEKNKDRFDGSVRVLHMWDASSGMIDAWHKYCQRQMRDSFHMLDEKLIFSNMKATKRDYASKQLDYPLEPGDCPAYEKLIGTLYSPEERRKIEWAIGSIVCGDSKKLQKFLVLYGASGTGKTTILNIVQQLFEGYCESFEARRLGSASDSFAMEVFRSNPLVAIDQDGDLAHIENNTRINSLVSHDRMTVNEKFKATYTNQFKCFLFVGTNKPVRITDAKSGLIRRLIDVYPTGEKIPFREYSRLVHQVSFELGAIAWHCREVYQEDPEAYNDYIPIKMLDATNDFYNFVSDSYTVFKQQDGTTMTAAWEMYKKYCDEAKVAYPYGRRPFAEELKNYFTNYESRGVLEDGTRVRSYYSGFRTEKFEPPKPQAAQSEDTLPWILLDKTESLLDREYADRPAQYATAKGTPKQAWTDVTTTLSDLNTTQLHYILAPETHIFIDFDLRDESGNKSLEKNLEAANKWPRTYAEVSQGGQGLHLHYIYTGDASQLSPVYADHIEVKTCIGKRAMRRRVSKCNDIPLAMIGSGLPLKKEKPMVNEKRIQSEKGLRRLIVRALMKEIQPHTVENVQFIKHILDEAYEGNLQYDVSDMYNDILTFALDSTNSSDKCLKLVKEMKLKSKETEYENFEMLPETSPIIFYDVEVFPNLFLVNWKEEGEGKQVHRMINPTPAEIENLLKMKLVGFNCRRYDNHMLYARLIGYTNAQLYELSQKIVGGKEKTKCFFGEAYNISYTDIYDFSSTKQSLKKFEIELGIHHQELGLPWDQPVPEEQWERVAEYCDNDVLATEAVFHARKADFTARRILADVAGMTVNDTTNSLTTRIIFGSDRNPQEQFNYRDMSDTKNAFCRLVEKPGSPHYHFDGGTDDGTGRIKIRLPDPKGTLVTLDSDYTLFDEQGRPVFPGYTFFRGKSIYREEEVGEGGYVYAEPGMYTDVALLDIASMHPSSIVAEQLFGEHYTQRFKDILDARIAIKHKDFDKARTMLDGKLAKYLDDESAAKDLAQALKIAINSVYGLTAAGFDNPFRDNRNVDNIVAKRGALFMINLKHEVQKLGFTVAHIKTDSIKIPNATPEIIDFVIKYGRLYGYNFEHEATYDRMCLVNDAVYIAKYKGGDHDGEWTATGTQFQVPYVFKTLFSKEDIRFDDMCETKSVTTALYLDMNEGLPEDEHDYHFVGRVGRFCPIKPGHGGGILLRSKNDGGYSAATGSKGYRWLEAENLTMVEEERPKEEPGIYSEAKFAEDEPEMPLGTECLDAGMVRKLGKEDDIDRSYYDAMVDEAIKTIAKYGDFEWFVSDEDGVAPWNATENADACPFDVR